MDACEAFVQCTNSIKILHSGYVFRHWCDAMAFAPLYGEIL